MDRRKALKITGSMAAASVAGTSFLSLLQSCEEVVRIDWTPEFLTLEEARFLATLVDMWLPRTETPGALDVKADVFIDKVFAHLYPAEGQQQVRSEMAQFNNDCKAKFGEVFASLSEGERIQVIQEAEEKGGQFPRGVWGTAVGPQEPLSFYRSLKSMTLWAYTSSEEVGKNVLNYDPIPGAYHGCVPLSEIGNKWSL